MPTPTPTTTTTKWHPTGATNVFGEPLRRWRNGKRGPEGQCSWCGALFAAGATCDLWEWAPAAANDLGGDYEPAEWRCGDCLVETGNL